MVRRSSNTVTVAAMAALALCLHAAAAYPASMERVIGDNNNFLPARNSPSRDLDRFIGPCEDCVPGSSPDEFAVKRDVRPPSGNRLKRNYSLDRLEPGYLMAGKRDRSPRLSPFEGPRDTVDRLGAGGPLSVRRRPTGSRSDHVRLHHRWADFVRRFADDRDSFYYFGDDNCAGCGPVEPPSPIYE